MERFRVRSGDVEIAYAVEGHGADTVLLITGLGWRSADWGTAFPTALAERYRVVRMDNRGTGASGVATGMFSLEDMAADAIAVLDAVGAEKAHVVGISMGGMITQLLALDHAHRVARIVLVATHHGGPNVVPPTAEALQMFDPQAFIERGRDPVRMMQYQLEVICTRGFAERDPGTIQMMLDNVRAEPTPSNGYIGQVQAILSSDREQRLGDIEHPALVVHGADDPLIPPANAQRLAERLPNAHLEMLEQCGHIPPLEQPDRFLTAVASFLAAS